MATITETQQSAFCTWWNSSGRYIFNQSDPYTIRALAESAFAEGIQAAEPKDATTVTGYETRYGVGYGVVEEAKYGTMYGATNGKVLK